MQRTAKINIILALLSMALLVFNPAGFCAGSPMAKSPSHPCCPSAPHQHDSAKTSCVCIDRQPAAPSLPANDTGGQIAAISPYLTPQPGADHSSWEFRDFHRVAFAPQDLCLQFHQLLL